MKRKILYGLYLLLWFEIFSKALFFIPGMAKYTECETSSVSWRTSWIRRNLWNHFKKEMTFSFDIYDPTKGWNLKSKVSGLQVFGNKTLHSNSLGVRGEKEFSLKKEAGIQRIVVLGDSFTFGEDLSDDETYSYTLQEQLGPRAEVINLGVHGYGHDQMLLKLKEEGIQYQPDLILLGFTHVDMARNIVNFRDYAKPQYFQKKDGLVLKYVPVPKKSELWMREIFRLHTWDALRLIADRLQIKKGIIGQKKMRITEALLEEMRKVSESVHAKFVLLYLPLQYEVEPRGGLMPEEKFITDYARRKGLLFCQPREDLKIKMQNKKFSTPSGHYQPATQKVVGESLAKCLREQGLVSSDLSRK